MDLKPLKKDITETTKNTGETSERKGNTKK
jgi:hypothetical protein